jgi:hypothetical protein
VRQLGTRRGWVLLVCSLRTIDAAAAVSSWRPKATLAIARCDGVCAQGRRRSFVWMPYHPVAMPPAAAGPPTPHRDTSGRESPYGAPPDVVLRGRPLLLPRPGQVKPLPARPVVKRLRSSLSSGRGGSGAA